MSERWPGGIISQTAPVPSGPYQNSTAPGIWTMEQAAYWQSQGNWPTAGNTDPSAFIENLFQTWLYTGNGSTQTITNGIDLAGKGGMVWIKGRNNTQFNALQDTSRGAGFILYSNDISAQDNYAGYTGYLDQFNANGFQIKSGSANWNVTNNTYASWTFREQPKFFDIVTWTGDGTNYRQIPHNLGSAPGFMITRRIDSAANWWCYHRSLGDSSGIQLESTAPANNTLGTYPWNVTSTTFQVSSSYIGTNTNGGTYVAYLFAHDAGGFGLSGNENVISCGSFTTDGSGIIPTVNLGYEPQWILYKPSSTTGNWGIGDTMRGWGDFSYGQLNWLLANLSNAEGSGANGPIPTATGFTGPNVNFGAGVTYIYMTIRRGPMATPTLGTQVFSATAGTFSTPYTVTTGFPVDLAYNTRTNGSSRTLTDRLRGPVVSTSYRYLQSNSTASEVAGSGFGIGFQNNTAIIDNDFITGGPGVWWNFRRAPNFFDIVCYTGTGSSTTYAHNLGVVPEMMIVKQRNSAANWAVYHSALGNTQWIRLDDSYPASTASTIWNDTSPTSSVFTVGSSGTVSGSGGTYVAYLFASAPGVSKVGSYTGTGSTQTINCGFTSGARFVLIRRTDDWDGGNPSGNWWIWDTARGMIAGTDPRITTNTTAAQTNANWVYTESTGFQIVTNNAEVNASGGSYIFLAIA